MPDVVLYGYAQDEAVGTTPTIVGSGWCTVLQGRNAATFRAPDRYEWVVWDGLPFSGTVADGLAFLARQMPAASPEGGEGAC